MLGMVAISPIILLLMTCVFSLIACGLWGFIDTKGNHYHPIKRPITVASVFSSFFVVFVVTIIWIVAQQQPPVGITVMGLLFGMGLVFGMTAFAGAIGYFVGYRGDRNPMITGSYGGENPKTKVAETGNPYQPPST